MRKGKIILVEDNEVVLKSLRLIVSREFETVLAVSNPSLLPALLSKDDVDIIILDMNFVNGRQSGEEGIFWLDYIQEKENPPAVLLMTAFADVELAVSALKKGAQDFIVKPWNNEKLMETLLTIWHKRKETYPVDNDPEQEIYNTARLLINYFLKKYAAQFGKPIPHLSPDAEKLLLSLFEEGEMELLEESLEKALLLNDKQILREQDIHIDEGAQKGERHKLSLDDMEKYFIREVLSEKKGNLTLTAQQLNISRQTLYNKMRKYNL